MTKAIASTYNKVHSYRTQISYILVMGCFIMVAIYAFNVYRVISNTVALQGVESQSVILEGNVEELDSKYLELSSQITPDTLSAHGFMPGKVSAYISRTASLGSVAVSGRYEL